MNEVGVTVCLFMTSKEIRRGHLKGGTLKIMDSSEIILMGRVKFLRNFEVKMYRFDGFSVP